MDAIHLSAMSFYAHHGVAAEERSLGQRFLVDVRLELDLRAAAQTDDLDATVDYALVWETVRSAVEGAPLKLIESVGERVARAVLRRFDRVDGVWVRVSKPAAPIAGATTGGVAVELTRRRAELGEPSLGTIPPDAR